MRFPARLFCQGRPLRSRERKLRGLDSADGQAPSPATKGICFFFSSGNHARKKEKEENEMTERQHTTWGELLRDVVEKPGRLLEAYTAFYGGSPAWKSQHVSMTLSPRGRKARATWDYCSRKPPNLPK